MVDKLNMDEAGFWSEKLRPKLTTLCQAAKMRFHFERVENMVADGTPDVDYCLAGATGKIELKYAPRHPASDHAQVLGKTHGLRRSQIIWASRRSWAGGRTWCLVGSPKEVWLIDLRQLTPPAMAEIESASTLRLREMSMWYSSLHAWHLIIPALRS